MSDAFNFQNLESLRRFNDERNARKLFEVLHDL